MYQPAETDFIKQARARRVVPVSRELVVDLETPISVYEKVVGKQPGYLLESVEGGERFARYSFIGVDPVFVYSARGGRNQVVSHHPGYPGSVSEGSPVDGLRKLMQDFSVPPVAGLPRFFGGAVGYFAYDTVRYIENLPGTPVDDLELPEALFTVTRIVVIFDHLLSTVTIVYNALVDEDASDEDVRAEYARACRSIEMIVTRLRTPGLAQAELPAYTREITLRGNVSREQFERSVETVKRYIEAGDAFQVVLSQRLETTLNARPFDLYRVLRRLNPSPYMFYLDFGGVQLVGSSPEVLVRVEDGTISTRPLAGTRRRGATRAEDEALASELLADAKERAEHVMLVDLGRNDVGRVARYGTVSVTEFMSIEKYSHVMHLTSEVQGTLRDDTDVFSAFEACFPAGTLSGAPKVRAMEIIDELEPTRRGPYGGAVGYFGFSGTMDTCITIRTVVIKDGKAFVQAGAGIVADSVPEREYEECLNKARALLKALETAERGLA